MLICTGRPTGRPDPTSGVCGRDLGTAVDPSGVRTGQLVVPRTQGAPQCLPTQNRFDVFFSVLRQH